MGVRWRLLYMWGGSAGEMVFMPEATHEPTGIHFFVTQERPGVLSSLHCLSCIASALSAFQRHQAHPTPHRACLLCDLAACNTIARVWPGSRRSQLQNRTIAVSEPARGLGSEPAAKEAHHLQAPKLRSRGAFLLTSFNYVDHRFVVPLGGTERGGGDEILPNRWGLSSV